jgi:uncharacterized protein YdhG (YjbR/CyaY superfamily)
MKLIIIIPVNEENSLEKEVDQVIAVNMGDVDKEITISNGDSQDSTHEIIQCIEAKYPEIISYHSPINLENGASIHLGTASSSSELNTV